MEVTEIILNFAINSVSSLVWMSGLFTDKGRYGTLSLESSNLANLNTLKKRTATGSVHDGCIISKRVGHTIVFFGNGVFLIVIYYNAS